MVSMRQELQNSHVMVASETISWSCPDYIRICMGQLCVLAKRTIVKL